MRIRTNMDHKILCIDDDPFYQDLFKAILEPKGFEFHGAMDPATGWDTATKVKPDIITLDVMMPEQQGFFDGYGLLKKLKTDETLGEVPVLMISALGEKEDKQHAQELGASGYLSKQDMTPDNLVAKLKKLLAK